MSASPATIAGLSEKDWARVISLIERKWDDGEIMRVTGFKLSTIAAIRADFERVVG